MASINKLPEGIQVVLTPGEILNLPYTSENGTFRDAVRTISWKLLKINGSKFAKDKKFVSSVFEFINGEFVTIFLYSTDALNTPPTP